MVTWRGIVLPTYALACAGDWDSAAAEAVAASASDAATSDAAAESDSAGSPNAVYPLESRSGYCSFYNRQHFASCTLCNSIVILGMKASTNCVMDWRYCSGSIFSMSGVRLVSMNGALPSCSNHLCSTSRTSSLISYIHYQRNGMSQKDITVLRMRTCV